ncbi:MAG TPA: FAD-dependent oxidoreductase [Streptosporangiaceae bacterium]|jgi:3-phenylpropionate/trans-cinnamate dioxygenase ferredoxin reductase subunit
MQVVIAGGGLAGLRTVEELRSGGFEGPITMLAAESRPPYDRPPLSKAALAGEPDAAELEAELDTTLSADFGALQVDLHLGEPAAGLDLGAARVRTEAGEYPYDRLVLATGAAPIVLPGPGRQRFLRTHEDALELRARLRPGVRLVIVGAGWIGAELATAAAARGGQVTVVEGGPTPLAAAIGAEVGGRTVPWYAAAGIDLRTSARVESVEDGGLALPDGGWIPADEVVTAVGVRPAIGWLQDSGLALDNGVAVDPGLRTSAPGVFAAGDCAAFQSRRYGRRLRFEHWDIALHAPEVVAANIIADDRGDETGQVYDPVPYSWSEQFGRTMQYAGYHAGADRLLWRGPPPGPADASEPGPWTACWLAGDRLVALLAVDRPRDLLQGRRVIAAGTPVDPDRLADPAVPVKNATAA